MVIYYYCYLTLCGLVFLAQAVGGQASCALPGALYYFPAHLEKGSTYTKFWIKSSYFTDWLVKEPFLEKHCRVVQQVLELHHFVQWYLVKTLMREKMIPSQGHCLCGVHMFFYVDFLLHPKDVHMKWIGMSTLSQLSECGCRCVCECILRWKGVLSRVASNLAPWTARIDSDHLQPWTEIGGLEKN